MRQETVAERQASTCTGPFRETPVKRKGAHCGGVTCREVIVWCRQDMTKVNDGLGDVRMYSFAFEIENHQFSCIFRAAEEIRESGCGTPFDFEVLRLAYISFTDESNRPVTPFRRSSPSPWTHKPTLGRAYRLRSLSSL